MINVISGSSEVSSITHASSKKSTISAKNIKEIMEVKHTILGIDAIRFITKEHEKTMFPHHNTLIVSLMVVNYLVKRLLVEKKISSNIIFLDAYNILGLEKRVMTWKITLLIGFSGKVIQAV